jgi:hypothetical protein
MKVQKFGLAHEWQNDNVKEIACMSQNVNEHVPCKEVTTQIKCEGFLTFPQSPNKVMWRDVITALEENLHV